MAKVKVETEFDKQETARRREDALKRMLSTPHKPHSESHKPRKGKRAKARRPSTGTKSS